MVSRHWNQQIICLAPQDMVNTASQSQPPTPLDQKDSGREWNGKVVIIGEVVTVMLARTVLVWLSEDNLPLLRRGRVKGRPGEPVSHVGAAVGVLSDGSGGKVRSVWGSPDDSESQRC
jgi:hypothetical protein